jgi:hypothetical protein
VRSASGLRKRTRTVVVVAGVISGSALVAQAGFGAFGAAAAPRAPLISSAPLRPTISTRATVAFDRVPGLTYECALDANPYVRCPSPVTFRGLTRSLHVFRVRARSPAGTASRASAYSWTVVPPHRGLQARSRLRPILTTAPVFPWISRSATFAWLSQRSSKAECRLDAGRWRPCANLKTYVGLRRGTHAFRLRAKRANGLRSSVNRFVWRIGSSPPPPPPTITSKLDADTASPEAAFSFEIAAGSTAECRLDANDWEPCESPMIYVGLSTGRYTFCVRAIGADGVAGPATCVTRNVVSSEDPSAPSGTFTISGSFPGLLYPGSNGVLPLTVSNPYDFDLRVWGLSVTVRPGSSQPGCDGGANLQVTQTNTIGGSVSIVVPARGSATLPTQSATAPRVTMLDLAVNQDACKNAVFTFSYSGTGTRA